MGWSLAWGASWDRAWGRSWGHVQDWNAWGKSFGSSWNVSWGPITSVATSPSVRVVPSPGKGSALRHKRHDYSEGITWRDREEYRERKRLAEELRAQYAKVYRKAKKAPAAEIAEAAAPVAEYAPVNAPALPTPAQIDWGAIAEERRTIAQVRAAIDAIADIARAARAAQEQRAREDEEDAILAILLSD